MTMKIPINQLKTCPINSEIYRDSDVGDLVNSIGEVGLLQQSRWCKTNRQCWRFVCRFFNNKFIFTTLQVKSLHSCKTPPNRGIYCVLLNQPIRKPSEIYTHSPLLPSSFFSSTDIKHYICSGKTKSLPRTDGSIGWFLRDAEANYFQ